MVEKSGVETSRFEKSGVGKFMVQKSGIEMSFNPLTDEDSKKLEARSSQNSAKNATNTSGENDDTINSTREHKENVSQGQIIFFCLVIFIVTCLPYPDFQIRGRSQTIF